MEFIRFLALFPFNSSSSSLCRRLCLWMEGSAAACEWQGLALRPWGWGRWEGELQHRVASESLVFRQNASWNSIYGWWELKERGCFPCFIHESRNSRAAWGLVSLACIMAEVHAMSRCVLIVPNRESAFGLHSWAAPAGQHRAVARPWIP